MSVYCQLNNKPHPSDPRWARLIPPGTVALAFPSAHSGAPATTHELGGVETHGASQEVLTAGSSLRYLNHLKQRAQAVSSHRLILVLKFNHLKYAM